MVSFGLYLTYLLVIIAAIAAIVLPIMNSLSDPKSMMKSGIGVGAVIVLFLICWVIASGDVAPKFVGEISESTSKFVGGSMGVMYVLFFLAIGGVVYGEVTRLFK